MFKCFFAITGETGPGMDLGVLVSALSVFTVNTPRSVAGIQALCEPTLDVYKMAWDSGMVKVCLFTHLIL